MKSEEERAKFTIAGCGHASRRAHKQQGVFRQTKKSEGQLIFKRMSTSRLVSSGGEKELMMRGLYYGYERMCCNVATAADDSLMMVGMYVLIIQSFGELDPAENEPSC